MQDGLSEVTSKRYLLISFIIGGFFLFNLTRLVFLNIQKQQTIQARKSEVETLEKQVVQLRDRSNYYSTDEYLEREARDRLQLVKPNETLVVIPDSLKDRLTGGNAAPELTASSEQNMLQLWASLFLGGNELRRFLFDF